MSLQNVEIVERGFAHFGATGEMLPEILARGFVWDMSTFRGFVGTQERFEGMEGVRLFLSEWTENFDEWHIRVESYRDAGDQVVATCHQQARSKAGIPVEMRFAMVFTLRDGLETRMQMYADPAEALEAVGLEG